MANHYRAGQTVARASYDVGNPSGTSQNEIHVPYVRQGFNTTLFTETTTPLTGSATFTGTGRDLTAVSTASVGGGASNVNVGAAGSIICDAYDVWGYILADQAGTAFLEFSTDNSTFFTGATAAVVANTPLILSSQPFARYYRIRVVNGASAQGSFRVQSGWRR